MSKEVEHTHPGPYEYTLAEAVGGVMEKPDFTYHGIDTIMAHSLEEAIRIYKAKHQTYDSEGKPVYWYWEVVQLGNAACWHCKLGEGDYWS